MSLNAPFGARCFLTAQAQRTPRSDLAGLNAPFGARCFLTSPPWVDARAGGLVS